MGLVIRTHVQQRWKDAKYSVPHAERSRRERLHACLTVQNFWGHAAEHLRPRNLDSSLQPGTVRTTPLVFPYSLAIYNELR